MCIRVSLEREKVTVRKEKNCVLVFWGKMKVIFNFDNKIKFKIFMVFDNRILENSRWVKILGKFKCRL